MEKSKIRIIAGEGERGSVEGYATTVRGARRMITIACCGGDRWAYAERMSPDGEWYMDEEI